jgi:RimJ/RimL family protein N-acetyltransferase
VTIIFTPLAEDLLPLLHTWMARTHWVRWWGPQPTLAEVQAHYRPTIDGSDRTRCFIAEEDGVAIGFTQVYVPMGEGGGWWEDETDPGARGIDQSLADEARLGQGLGRRLVHAFASRVFEDPAVTLIQTDPSPDNQRAIRCYRAVGFQDVGVVSTPDGPALLMRLSRARFQALTRA